MPLRRPAKQTQSNPILSAFGGNAPADLLSPILSAGSIRHFGFGILKIFLYHYMLCIAQLSQINFLGLFCCEDRLVQNAVFNADRPYFVVVLM